MNIQCKKSTRRLHLYAFCNFQSLQHVGGRSFRCISFPHVCISRRHLIQVPLRTQCPSCQVAPKVNPSSTHGIVPYGYTLKAFQFYCDDTYDFYFYLDSLRQHPCYFLLLCIARTFSKTTLTYLEYYKQER